MNHTFYVQADCLEAIKTLPTEKRNAMLGAIAGYQIDESMPDFENEMMVIFMIAKVFIDQRKRRSLSHSRGKATEAKPKITTKSTRKSIEEIIEKISPDAKQIMPSCEDPTPKSVTQNKKKPTPITLPHKNTNNKNTDSLSPETQLAIRKLTALCNKSKHK